MHASLQLANVLHKFARAVNGVGVYIAYVVVVQNVVFFSFGMLVCVAVSAVSAVSAVGVWQLSLHDYKLGALT
jgi:hypothetical protein